MILTDNETKVDLLNNEAIATTIIGLLGAKPDHPVTIGVHGDWGAGKSSVLEMIEAGFAGLDNERHAAMVQAIPLNRMLTETDGPFTRTGDKPSRPADVAHVVEVLGRLRGLSADDVANLVRGNLRALLG